MSEDFLKSYHFILQSIRFVPLIKSFDKKDDGIYNINDTRALICTQTNCFLHHFSFYYITIRVYPLN